MSHALRHSGAAHASTPNTLRAKKQIELGIVLIHSGSTGSIKRALDIMLANGWIVLDSVEKGARGRKLYASTSFGEERFRTWMTEPLASADAETEAVARTYFLGMLPPSDQLLTLDAIISRANRDVEQLESLARDLDARLVDPKDDSVYRHQRASLDYGIRSHDAALRWFREYRSTLAMRAGNPDASFR